MILVQDLDVGPSHLIESLETLNVYFRHGTTGS